MSCSARLPVYVLFIAAFFPKHPGTVMFFIYSLGIILAIGTAIVFKKTIFRSEEVPFVMELPPYRLPTIKSTSRHMWFKAEQYLKKMGGVILVASVIIWALGYFPRTSPSVEIYNQKIQKVDKTYREKLSAAATRESQEQLITDMKEELNDLEAKKESERQKNSYIGRLGRAIQPVMRPLGFDWKMSVSLLTGVAAKEIVVSTLGVLYQVGPDADERSQSLIYKLQEQRYTYGKHKGEKVFNPLVALTFLVFILIYFPCVAVVAAIRKESGSWKWALFSVFYTTILAWVVAFMIYQSGNLILG
jgi:ferrous iron transport protein B